MDIPITVYTSPAFDSHVGVACQCKLTRIRGTFTGLLCLECLFSQRFQAFALFLYLLYRANVWAPAVFLVDCD